MDAMDDFKSFQDRISSSLIEVTKTSGQIATEDLAFQRSLNPSVAATLDRQNARLLDTAGRLAKAAALGSEVRAPRINDLEAVEENWQGVVDVIDSLLERADACLDEYTGVVKRLSPSGQEPAPTSHHGTARPARIVRDFDMAKPQLLFDRAPDNKAERPFKPLLTSKPHATRSLEESLDIAPNEERVRQFEHPYKTEIKQFTYPPSAYLQSPPIPYHPFDKTEAVFVDTPEAVAAMLAELKTAKEIAVDLEHHDVHSYIGLVSLMQISTRDKDWVIDTLKPWRHELQVLNEVFADPNIIKVFHGAHSDMIWLQRDFGLYVVGLFDTYHASRALGYTRHSLAALLDRFTTYKPDKRYQLADWRIRPLPQEMLDYARSDTHFLLFIYDNVRNELIERSDKKQQQNSLINVVLKGSKHEALQRFEWPFYDPDYGQGPNGWHHMLRGTPGLFSKQQFAVFKAVHQWRDSVAREEDESIYTVMSRQAMFNIATSMPTDVASLFGTSHHVSKPMRSRAAELLEIVKAAKEAGATGPTMLEFFRSRKSRNEGDTLTSASSTTVGHASQTQVHETENLRERATGSLLYRSDTSQFWGSTFGSSLWQASNQATALAEGLRFALPLPPLTAEIFRDADDVQGNSQEGVDTPRVAVAEHEYVKAREVKQEKADDVFVVKQLGGVRKRKTSDPQAAMDLSRITGDGTTLEQSKIDTEDGDAEDKARRKAERKAQKRRKREQEQAANATASGQGAEPDDYEPPEPFDYAKAESVLHAKADVNGGNARTKAFDPYTKSMDGPKAPRKVKREIAGKSFTFPK